MNGDFSLHPNASTNPYPPVPPPPPELQDDVIVSYGGELTFYLENNESAISDMLTTNQEKLDAIAENLDTIIPKYYLMELTQARQESELLNLQAETSNDFLDDFIGNIMKDLDVPTKDDKKKE